MITHPLTLLASHTKPLSVALVEDDRLLREEVQTYLEANNFVVHAVNSAYALDDLLKIVAINLYVIDIGLPGESGLSLSRRLRELLPQAGIVIMSARESLIDRITGYQEGGADIYLTKPATPHELVLVLRGLARRINMGDSNKAWTLSMSNRVLLSPHSSQTVRLTHREKKLFMALIQAENNTLGSLELCDLLIESEDALPMTKHSLEEFMRRVRKKLLIAHGEIAEGAIKSVWGVGYQLCITIVLR